MIWVNGLSTAPGPIAIGPCDTSSTTNGSIRAGVDVQPVRRPDHRDLRPRLKPCRRRTGQTKIFGQQRGILPDEVPRVLDEQPAHREGAAVLGNG